MKEHFDSASTMRAALVRGDMAGFRAAASVLSDEDLGPNVAPAWQQHLEGMRVAAKGARDAEAIGDGTAALADVARECASCHTQLGVPKVAPPPEPAGGSGTAAHMRRHAWATDLMWLGVATPSEDLWRRGAEVFAEAALAPEEVAGSKTVPAEITELAQLAHAAGADAHQVEPAKRADAFAKVMGTCTGCHAQLGVRPGS